MSSVSEVIIQCGNILHNGGEEVNTVTSVLLPIYENLENLPEIFNVNQQCEVPFIRELSVIGIKNILRVHLAARDLPEEILAFVKQAIVQGLQMEIGEESKKWYCIIAGMIVEVLGASEYPEIVELAFSFLQDEHQIQTGLMLLIQICHYFTPAEIEAHIEILLQVIIQTLNGANSNFRLLATQLFKNIVDNASNYQPLISNQELQTAIQNAYTRVFSDPQCPEQERYQIVGTLSQILRTDATFDIIEPSFRQLYHVTLDALFNEALSPMIRLDSLDFFNGVIETKPTLAENILEQLIETIVPLTVEQCKLERTEYEQFEPHYSDRTIEILASHEDLADDLIATILGYAQEALEADEVDQPTLQVLIQFFDPLLDGASQLMMPYEPDITPVLQAALSDGDEYLVAATCQTIKNMSNEYPPFFHQNLQSYLEVLIQLCEHQDVLPTFEILLFNGPSPISNATEICGLLLSIPSQVEGVSLNQIIRCISACVSKSKQSLVDPGLYQAIKEFLLAALEEQPETNDTVYECFSNCCQIAPQAILEDMPSIFESMAQLISLETMQFIPSVCEAIGNFTRFFPSSTAQFIIPCAEAMIPFLVNDTKQTTLMSKQEEIESEEEKQVSLQGSIMLCLSTFASSSPEQAGQFIEPLLNLINEWITADKDDQENMVCFAADSIVQLAPALHQLEIDPQPLLNHLLSAISSPTDVDVTNNLLVAFANLLIEIPDKLNEESVQHLFTFFTEVLSGANQDFNGIDDQIDIDIQDAFFFALKTFVLSGLITKADPAEIIISLASKIADLTQLNLFGLSILAISRISFILDQQATAEIAQQCVTAIASALAQEEVPLTPDVKNNIYSAIVYLASSHFAVFEQEAIELIVANLTEDLANESSTQTLKANSSLALLEIAANGVALSPEALQAAIALMPPQCDEEDCALYARAAVALSASNAALLPPAAVQVLASQDWVLSMVPQEMIPILCAAVKTLPEETIKSSLNGNEGTINKLASRLPSE